MGSCPGNEESAGVNYGRHCPKGQPPDAARPNQAANAAVKAKGPVFAVFYRRLVPRLGHAQAIRRLRHRAAAKSPARENLEIRDIDFGADESF
jgi:hypothetical protein